MTVDAERLLRLIGLIIIAVAMVAMLLLLYMQTHDYTAVRLIYVVVAWLIASMLIFCET